MPLQLDTSAVGRVPTELPNPGAERLRLQQQAQQFQQQQNADAATLELRQRELQSQIADREARQRSEERGQRILQLEREYAFASPQERTAIRREQRQLFNIPEAERQLIDETVPVEVDEKAFEVLRKKAGACVRDGRLGKKSREQCAQEIGELTDTYVAAVLRSSNLSLEERQLRIQQIENARSQFDKYADQERQFEYADREIRARGQQDRITDAQRISQQTAATRGTNTIEFGRAQQLQREAADLTRETDAQRIAAQGRENRNTTGFELGLRERMEARLAEQRAGDQESLARLNANLSRINDSANNVERAAAEREAIAQRAQESRAEVELRAGLTFDNDRRLVSLRAAEDLYNQQAINAQRFSDEKSLIEARARADQATDERRLYTQAALNERQAEIDAGNTQRQRLTERLLLSRQENLSRPLNARDLLQVSQDVDRLVAPAAAQVAGLDERGVLANKQESAELIRIREEEVRAAYPGARPLDEDTVTRMAWFEQGITSALFPIPPAPVGQSLSKEAQKEAIRVGIAASSEAIIDIERSRVGEVDPLYDTEALLDGLRKEIKQAGYTLSEEDIDEIVNEVVNSGEARTRGRVAPPPQADPYNDEYGGLY